MLAAGRSQTGRPGPRRAGGDAGGEPSDLGPGRGLGQGMGLGARVGPKESRVAGEPGEKDRWGGLGGLCSDGRRGGGRSGRGPGGRGVGGRGAEGGRAERGESGERTVCVCGGGAREGAGRMGRVDWA